MTPALQSSGCPLPSVANPCPRSSYPTSTRKPERNPPGLHRAPPGPSSQTPSNPSKPSPTPTTSWLSIAPSFTRPCSSWAKWVPIPPSAPFARHTAPVAFASRPFVPPTPSKNSSPSCPPPKVGGGFSTHPHTPRPAFKQAAETIPGSVGTQPGTDRLPHRTDPVHPPSAQRGRGFPFYRTVP